MGSKLFSSLIVLLSFAAGLSNAAAQEKLRFAWAGFSPTNSPVWVIGDRKLLQKQGVDPQIISINASPTVLQALLAPRAKNKSSAIVA